ncbi:MAG: hypothetical protein KF847_10060, partial [Pirellulales bacterium]|nr:hypothetical protein [Pirellulales bacterium]
VTRGIDPSGLAGTTIEFPYGLHYDPNIYDNPFPSTWPPLDDNGLGGYGDYRCYTTGPNINLPVDGGGNGIENPLPRGIWSWRDIGGGWSIRIRPDPGLGWGGGKNPFDPDFFDADNVTVNPKCDATLDYAW